MSAHSLTYQQLPQWLLQPLLDGHLTVAEASQLWDEVLTSRRRWVSVPPNLQAALQRLHLRGLETDPTLH
ncbi:hypothetical protein ABXN37_22560 [Piscinibacter sakaiensis]|uniref:hypothetical protein n=1 Tax=Piscinibacter sakaiensis TaxID=1547922 RepID=UPI0037288357